MAQVLRVEWTDTAKHALRNIYEFHAEHAEESAFRIVTEIVEKADSIIYMKQFQVDDINPDYRRIVVGYYKVLYRVQDSVVKVMNVFPTRSDSRKLERL
ncbi:MAG: hypothetical protein GC178_16180 [Flavobacteriales bacterium]|nr:hypothetical protein [Flavobacteriales bacterium]